MATMDLARVNQSRFWRNVDIRPGSCWIWLGPVNGKGYGTYGHWMAHRLAWTLCVGTIEDELTLDHRCRVRICVNPDHLEPVTNRENIMRGNGPAAVAARAAGGRKPEGP